MSLKMSRQAILELLDSNEPRYRKAKSRKEKGELLAQLAELTGYKSSKNIIRYYSKKKERRARPCHVFCGLVPCVCCRYVFLCRVRFFR